MNVSHCRQSQRRRFVSLNTTINIDFNHIALSRAPLMLCRFFFRSFLFWPPMLVPPIFAPHLTLFFFFALRFIWLELPMPSEFMPAREKKNLLYLCGVRHKFIRETDSVDFVYFEEMTMSISHARCCYFDCRSRLRRSVAAVAIAIDIINAYTRERKKNV